MDADGSERRAENGRHAFDDLDTNARLRSDDSPETNAFGAVLFCGGFEYAVSCSSLSVTAGKKHGVDVRLDQNDLFCSPGVGGCTYLPCARSLSSFFFLAAFLSACKRSAHRSAQITRIVLQNNNNNNNNNDDDDSESVARKRLQPLIVGVTSRGFEKQLRLHYSFSE